MSCVQSSSRRIPGENPEKFCNSSVRDNWVYVSSEGAEITTLETHGRSLSSSNNPPKVEPYNLSKGRLGNEVNSGEAQISVSTLKSHRDSEHAIALLSELRRVRILYKHSRGQYQMCCEQLSSCLSRPATTSSEETHAWESKVLPGTHDLQRYLESLNVQSEALDRLESQLDGLDDVFGIGKEPVRKNDLNVDGEREVAYCELDSELDSELERQTELSNTSSNAPPAAEDYFAKAREVFVIKERLAELDQEQSDRSSQLQPEFEESDNSRRDDTESEDGYHSQRQKLLEALVLAESELHELREACVREGIEPELNRYRRVSERQDRSSELISEYYHTLSAPIRLVRDALAYHNLRQ